MIVAFLPILFNGPKADAGGDCNHAFRNVVNYRVKSIRISAYLTHFKQYLNLRGGFCGLCVPARKWESGMKEGPAMIAAQ